MHRLAVVTDALHNDTRYEYDPVGNLTKVTDANGHSTTFFYDSRNREVRPVGESS